MGKEKLDAFRRTYDVIKETVREFLPEKRFQLTEKTLDGGIFGGSDGGTIRGFKSGRRNIKVTTLQDIADASNKTWLEDWKTEKMKGGHKYIVNDSRLFQSLSVCLRRVLQRTSIRSFSS